MRIKLHSGACAIDVPTCQTAQRHYQSFLLAKLCGVYFKNLFICSYSRKHIHFCRTLKPYSGTSAIDVPTDSPVLLSEPMPLCCLTATEQPYSSDIITASSLLYKKLSLSLTANIFVPDCQQLHRINTHTIIILLLS